MIAVVVINALGIAQPNQFPFMMDKLPLSLMNVFYVAGVIAFALKIAKSLGMINKSL